MKSNGVASPGLIGSGVGGTSGNSWFGAAGPVAWGGKLGVPGREAGADGGVP